jgi:hypothetical protein
MIAVDVQQGTIGITMTGIVSDADWDAAVRAVDEKLGGLLSVHPTLPGSRRLHLLMDWAGLNGWEKGTRSTCTWFCMGNQDMVDRVAVVADEQWRQEVLRLTDIYKHARLRLYKPAERQMAIDWLMQP